MKRILPILALLFCVSHSFGAAATNAALFYMRDFQLQPQKVRQSYIYFLGAPTGVLTNLVQKDRIVKGSDTNGFFGLTNFVAGVYRVEHQGTYGATTNFFSFPDTNGTINAVDWLTNAVAVVGLTNVFVTQIVAGNNVTVSPSNGRGIVTVNSSGGGSGSDTNRIANLNGRGTNTFLTNAVLTSGYTTNQTNFFREGSLSARESFWTFNGASGNTWISPSTSPGGVKAVIDLRNDPEPNSVIYLGDASSWDAISMQMKGGGSSGTDANYPSNRFTISFADVWGWRFNQLNLNVGSGQSFGAQSQLQCNVISHDDNKNITFGNTNGQTTLRGTNLLFQVTNGLAGGSQAPANAGMVTKNKGWTFYGAMTNSGGPTVLGNGAANGLFFKGLGGDASVNLYVMDDGSDDLHISGSPGGIIFDTALGDITISGNLTMSGLTASRMLLTASDKKLSSASASGAVPMDADGSATTFAQINALAPGNVLTNNESIPTVFRNTLTASNIFSTTYVSATNGVCSFSPVAAVSIAATGWTNIWSTNNATVYVTATAVAFTIKDRANATIYTSPTLTTTVPVTLQPGWAVMAASGLAGTALPW